MVAMELFALTLVMIVCSFMICSCLKYVGDCINALRRDR
jgi:hypothetical protein